MRAFPGKQTALAALVALLGISPAFADGMPQFDPDMLEPGTLASEAPVSENAATDSVDSSSNIERLTFQPTREGPVDRVEPMDVHTLPGVSPAAATPATASDGAMRDAVRVIGADDCDGNAGFVAEIGRNVEDTLSGWAACSGWAVRWDSDHAYVLEASAEFGGDFVAAASALVGAFAKAEPPLFGEFYATNRVLVVTTPTELGNQ